MLSKHALRLVVLVTLITLVLGTVAFAQEGVTESLPTDLGELKTPAGLSVIVVIVVGLLKRAGKFGEWMQAAPLNSFGVSLAVAGVILGGIYLIEYFGVWDIAQGFWLNFGVMWTVSQGFYNVQKVATKTTRAMLDA